MQRLIDANAAISAFADMGQDIDTHDVIDLLKEQPTVDAVPVTRCGECAKWKHEKTESHDFYRCEKGNHWSKKKYDDWFCADGKRKE